MSDSGGPSRAHRAGLKDTPAPEELAKARKQKVEERQKEARSKLVEQKRQAYNSVRVTYWQGRGRVEQQRVLLAACGVNFEDSFLSTPEEFEELKKSGKLTYGQLPLVEMDGLCLVQSMAQLRYVAQKYGFWGNNLQESYKVDLVIEGACDARVPLLKYPFKKDAKASIDAFNTVRYCATWESMLNESESDYFLSKPSAADAVVFELLEFFKMVCHELDEEKAAKGEAEAAKGEAEAAKGEAEGAKGEFESRMKPFPKLRKLFDSIQEVGRLKEYVANRQHLSWDGYATAVNVTLGR